MKYRQASLADLREIEKLLEVSNLPPSDCAPHIDNFIVAELDGTIIGAGGFERCGELALLRSFAVRADHKNNRIAEKIFQLVKDRATDSGIQQFYLLTTTASHYFKRLGFSVCSRRDLPVQIKQTKQFEELCPSGATAMVLDL